MVKWTRHAKRQLRHIHEYIAQDSPFYATRVSEELVKRTLGLDEITRKGRKVPELNEDLVREISLYSYWIIYEIKADTTPAAIDVLAVIHKRRDLKPDDIPRTS